MRISWELTGKSAKSFATVNVNPTKEFDMPEPLIGRVKENTLNNPPCPITPCSQHHLYIIHLINYLHCFYRLAMSLKWLLIYYRKGTQSNNLQLHDLDIYMILIFNYNYFSPLHNTLNMFIVLKYITYVYFTGHSGHFFYLNFFFHYHL